MWLMETAEGEEKTLRCLAARLLTINFAAMHTSSMVSVDVHRYNSIKLTLSCLQSFTQALYHLAGNPEYMQPLREEVESIVATYGWSKDSLNKMRKVDSFLRESQRFNGLGLCACQRSVLVTTEFQLTDSSSFSGHVAIRPQAIHVLEWYHRSHGNCSRLPCLCHTSRHTVLS